MVWAQWTANLSYRMVVTAEKVPGALLTFFRRSSKPGRLLSIVLFDNTKIDPCKSHEYFFTAIMTLGTRLVVHFFFIQMKQIISFLLPKSYEDEKTSETSERYYGALYFNIGCTLYFVGSLLCGVSA